MKSVITITKQEIEASIRETILKNISAGYSYEVGEFQVNFNNADGDIGYFMATAEADITVKERE